MVFVAPHNKYLIHMEISEKHDARRCGKAQEKPCGEDIKLAISCVD
jgi:hypothetical protein